MTRYFLNRCAIAFILLNITFHASAQTADEYLKAGQKKFANKVYKEALLDFDKAILLNPESIEAYNAKGLCLYNLEEYIQARDVFGTIVKLDSTNAVAYNNIAFCHFKMLKIVNAYNNFTKAITINPNYAEAYYNRGMLRSRYKSHLCAIGDFTAALMIDSSLTKAWNNRAISFQKTRQYGAAILDFNNAIAIDTVDKLLSHFNRGICYEAIGKNDEAAKDYDTVLMLYTSKPSNSAYLKQPRQLKHLHSQAKKIIKKAYPGDKQWDLKI